MLNENIKAIRKSKGLSQQELAARLNIVRQTVSKWEQGNGIPDVRILVQLAELFHVSVDDLVREHTEKEIVPKNTRTLRRIIIILWSVGLCWLVAVALFVSIGIFAPGLKFTWLAFLYAVPASAIVVLVFSCVWGYKAVRVISVSVLIWTVLACTYLTAYAFGQNIWLIFLIGIPLQVLALFFFVWWKRAHFFRK